MTQSTRQRQWCLKMPWNVDEKPGRFNPNHQSDDDDDLLSCSELPPDESECPDHAAYWRSSQLHTGRSIEKFSALEYAALANSKGEALLALLSAWPNLLKMLVVQNYDVLGYLEELFHATEIRVSAAQHHNQHHHPAESESSTTRSAIVIDDQTLRLATNLLIQNLTSQPLSLVARFRKNADWFGGPPPKNDSEYDGVFGNILHVAVNANPNAKLSIQSARDLLEQCKSTKVQKCIVLLSSKPTAAFSKICKNAMSLEMKLWSMNAFLFDWFAHRANPLHFVMSDQQQAEFIHTHALDPHKTPNIAPQGNFQKRHDLKVGKSLLIQRLPSATTVVRTQTDELSCGATDDVGGEEDGGDGGGGGGDDF